jgi:signal recognition particle subunit SRP68
VGRSHSILSNKKNALALYARALDLATKSASSNTTPDTPQATPKLSVSAGQIKTLCLCLQGLVWKYRGLVEMQNLSSANEKGDNTSYTPPLIERMDYYPSGEVDLANLVTYPPKIEPVPVKPLFLDVAWNYIDYPRPGDKATPVAKDAANTPAAETKEGKRGGWFSFGR